MKKLKAREVNPLAQGHPAGVPRQAAHIWSLCTSPQYRSYELIKVFSMKEYSFPSTGPLPGKSW